MVNNTPILNNSKVYKTSVKIRFFSGVGAISLFILGLFGFIDLISDPTQKFGTIFLVFICLLFTVFLVWDFINKLKFKIVINGSKLIQSGFLIKEKSIDINQIGQILRTKVKQQPDFTGMPSHSTPSSSLFQFVAKDPAINLGKFPLYQVSQQIVNDLLEINPSISLVFNPER